ncbi:MAG: carbohydrate ABC transporter permease [Clostridia bacterium]|jgi:ABC-type glycerol-3-phosphate transport system permease component|nr:carbohydrate ABC transporter permease [Clostridia bacterium]
MVKARKSKRKYLYITVAVILGIYALTMLIPLYFVVINSLKRPSQFYDNPWTLPKVLYLANYRKVFSLSVDEVSVLGMYVNSIILTGASTLISCAATTVTAYTVARFEFRGKSLLVAVGIGAMLIPDLGSRSVIYKMYVDLHMIDTWFILIQYATPFGMMFLITYSLFKTVSKTYAEAAKIDGASELRIFLQIMIPMAKGCIGMMMVMSAIGAWNDYYTPYMYLPSVKTLALGLQELTEQAQTYSNFTELYAAMVVAILPVLILFICMRDTIINNAVAGGLKE